MYINKTYDKEIKIQLIYKFTILIKQSMVGVKSFNKGGEVVNKYGFASVLVGVIGLVCLFLLKGPNVVVNVNKISTYKNEE